MNKDVWVSHISDYRKWQVRLYVELYSGNEYYTTVFYDIRNNIWDFKYKNHKKEIDIDFFEIEMLVREELLKQFKLDETIPFSDKYPNEINFQHLSDLQGYNIYLVHPKFRTEYQKKIALTDKREKREFERRRKECWCECGSSLFYIEIVRKCRRLDEENKLLDSVIENIPDNNIEPYLECRYCGNRYKLVKKKNKYYRGEKM